jgi:hypothetical protein
MAVNTAYVASSELLERVAHRYNFEWLVATNRSAALYRVHILNASLYTAIILITAGSQQILADMYAIGLLASFCINVGCLLIYRYFQGTRDIRDYYTSRWHAGARGDRHLFVYLAIHKPHGTILASVVGVLLAADSLLAPLRSRATAFVRRLPDDPQWPRPRARATSSSVVPAS